VPACAAAGWLCSSAVAAVAACGSSSKHAPGTRLDRARLTRIVVGGPASLGPPDRQHPVVAFVCSGGGITNARVEVGSADGKLGKAVEASLEHDVGPRLVGPHFSAESQDDSYAFGCGDVVVFVDRPLHR
jgi:hypothetical protein